MAEKNQTNWSADWNPNQTNIKHVNPILTILSNCSTFSNIKSHQTIKLSSHRGIYFAVESYYKKTSGSGNYINQYPITSKSVTHKTTVQYSTAYHGKLTPGLFLVASEINPCPFYLTIMNCLYGYGWFLHGELTGIKNNSTLSCSIMFSSYL